MYFIIYQYMFEDNKIQLFKDKIGESDNTNTNAVLWEWDNISETG